MNNGKITGHLVDTLHYKDGTEKVIDHGYNTITNGLHQLLARLMAGTADSDDALTFVVGNSETTPSAGDTDVGDVIVSKAATASINEGTPHKVKVSCTIGADEGNGDNGGNRTWHCCGVKKGSVLINRKLATLEKNSSFSVTRTFEFIF